MERKSKEELLKIYDNYQPQLFIKYEGNSLEGVEEGLSEEQMAMEVFCADSEGHSLFSRTSYELMAGTDLRVVIKAGLSKETVMALLTKIKDRIERNSTRLDDGKEIRTMTPSRLQTQLGLNPKWKMKYVAKVGDRIAVKYLGINKDAEGKPHLFEVQFGKPLEPKAEQKTEEKA